MRSGPIFDGYHSLKWIRSKNKMFVILVYKRSRRQRLNMKVIQLLRLLWGRISPADEGYGARPVPTVKGAPKLRWHITNRLITGFDMNRLSMKWTVDHGSYCLYLCGFWGSGRLALQVKNFPLGPPPPPLSPQYRGLSLPTRASLPSFG